VGPNQTSERGQIRVAKSILRKYVREEHALTLEDAIRKFTALPAEQMRLTDRGVLKQGMWADVVIFDPEAILDPATYEQPNQPLKGMEHLLVNGVPVIAEGKMTGALLGELTARLRVCRPVNSQSIQQPLATRTDSHGTSHGHECSEMGSMTHHSENGPDIGNTLQLLFLQEPTAEYRMLS